VGNDFLPHSARKAIDDSQFTFIFRNEGPTVAEMLGDCFVCRVTKALEPTPRYPMHSHWDNKMFGKLVGTGINYSTMTRAHLTGEDRAAVIDGNSFLWIYGYIEYRDFLDTEWQKGFVTALRIGANTGKGEFITEGPPAYTYTRIRDG
jgi:hypothetical protein